jgi:hypothetical protein
VCDEDCSPRDISPNQAYLIAVIPVIETAPHRLWAPTPRPYILIARPKGWPSFWPPRIKLPKLADSDDEVGTLDELTPRPSCALFRNSMSPSGDDPNPWYFGNEMTINGCQGWRSSASASPANDSTKPGKPRTSDRQPVPEDPNATTGTNW